METTSKSVGSILVLFNKTVSGNNIEPDVCEKIRGWIKVLDQVDPTTKITFNLIDGEYRLWFLLESQKTEIMAQLTQVSTVGDILTTPTTEHNQTYDEVEEVAVKAIHQQHEESTALQSALTDIENIIVTQSLIEKPTLPVDQSEIKSTSTVISSKKEITDVEKTAVMNNLFSQSRELAASAFQDQQSFQDRLCNALEKGFYNINIQSIMQNEAIMERLNSIATDIKQEIVDSETRINKKLVAIYRTTAACANKTEAISAMFDSFKTTSNHSPAYTDKI